MTKCVLIVALCLLMKPNVSACQDISTSQIFEEEGNRLALSTCEIEAIEKGRTEESGTGFWYRAASGMVFLITARHLAIDPTKKDFRPDAFRLRLHKNNEGISSSGYDELPLYKGTRPAWREIDSTTDIIAIPIQTSLQSKYLIMMLSARDLAPHDLIISMTDSVVSIGYPDGFYDFDNNLPTAQEGSISSVYGIDFDGKHLFLIDAVLPEGTSGSPVFTKPSATLVTKDGNQRNFNHINTEMAFLLGVNTSYQGKQLHLSRVWYADIIKKLVND